MNLGIAVLVAITAGRITQTVLRPASTEKRLSRAISFNVEGEKLLDDNKNREADRVFKSAISPAWDFPTS